MRSLLLLLFWFSSLPLFSQQLPVFSQFREMTGYLNPASIKTDYFIFDTNVSVGGVYRQQWASHPLSPSTMGAHADFLFENRGFSLITGGYVLKDEVGATDFTGFYGRIGGLIGNPQRGGLAVGFSVGSQQHRIDPAGLAFFDEGDINEGLTINESVMDVGAGVFFYRINDQRDVFYAGISIPQVLGSELTLSTPDGTEYDYDREPHYFAQAGYIKTIGDFGYLEGQVTAKGVNSLDPSFDFNLRYLGLSGSTNTGLWAGIGGGTTGVVMAEAGVVLGDLLGDETQLKLGYSPSYSFASFGPAFGISHEFNISYLFFVQTY
jgi:type IX secretion system PorP/SprF family membrane protein